MFLRNLLKALFFFFQLYPFDFPDLLDLLFQIFQFSKINFQSRLLTGLADTQTYDSKNYSYFKDEIKLFYCKVIQSLNIKILNQSSKYNSCFKWLEL